MTATKTRLCSCGRRENAVVGGRIAHWSRTRIITNGETLDVLKCHVVDSPRPGASEECETMLLPTRCPIDVGDSVWRSGHLILWTPKSRAFVDLPFVRPERYRGLEFRDERIRWEVLAALERGWKGWAETSR